MNNREKSWQQYEVARYLLKTTYPSVGDPKLLLTVLSNLHAAVEEGLSYLIGPHLTFREKLAYAQRKGFPADFLEQLHEVMEIHKKSPIEFTKHGTVVICSSSYDIKNLNAKVIEEFLSKTKSFLEQVDRFLIENNK